MFQLLQLFIKQNTTTLSEQFQNQYKNRKKRQNRYKKIHTYITSYFPFLVSGWVKLVDRPKTPLLVE